MDEKTMQAFRSSKLLKYLKGASYNQFHNVLRLVDVLPNFPFTTSETMGDYYWYIRVASPVIERLKT